MSKTDYLDIHSHILPHVDDGAKDIKETVRLLTLLKEQGVSRVIATPHFDASEDNVEVYENRIAKSYQLVLSETKGMDLPRIFLGSEVLYFTGMGKVEDIRRLCTVATNFLLIEFGMLEFNHRVCDDLVSLKEHMGITPVIAHIERYYNQRGYDNLLQLVENGIVFSQVNASSLFMRPYSRVVKKLIKHDLVTFIASDAHSVEHRPPHIKQALDYIAAKFGPEVSNQLIKNAQFYAAHLFE